MKEWFQGRISNGFFVEKHYSYPNPRGKDSNIYEFDIKEYFALRYTEKKNSISPIRLTTLPNESDQARPQTTIFRSESDKKLLSTKSNNFIKISQIINKNAQIIQVIPNKVDLEISGLAPPNVASTNFSNKSNQVPRKLTTVKKFQKTEDNYKTPSDVSLVDYDTGAPRQILDERKLRPKKNYSRSTTRLRGTKPIEEKVDFTSLNMRFNDIKVPIFESSIMKTYMSGVNGQTPGGH